LLGHELQGSHVAYVLEFFGDVQLVLDGKLLVKSRAHRFESKKRRKKKEKKKKGNERKPFSR